MTIDNNPYFLKYKEEFSKRKNLEIKTEKLQKELDELKERIYTAAFYEREQIRYEKGLKHIKTVYDNLLEKTEFLQEAHEKLIMLFQKYLLLDEKFSNVKLSDQSKNELIKQARLILIEENKKYPLGKTYIKIHNN